MNSKQDMDNWYAERINQSAVKLATVLQAEAECELMGIPGEIAQGIHIRAIFEVLAMLNRNGRGPLQSEPRYKAFMEFMSHEYSGYAQMCLRMQAWNAEDPNHEAANSTPMSFRRNASRN